MSIKISCAKPAHLQLIGLQATRLSACRFINHNSNSETLSRLCETAWCLSHAKAIFGVAGYLVVQPGHAVCWAMFDTNVTSISAIALTRKVGNGIQAEMKRAGLCRLESAVDISDLPALRWARLLGFEIEGLMRKSSSINTDQWLIARIME